jgi:polysaccharide pyruvyl transferase WcaK-like protein
LANELAVAMNQLSAQGYRFVGILMNADDKAWTERVLDGVAAEIVRPHDATAVAAAFARCSLAIVSRLHAGILASLSDTPLIAVEYQPKCRDFALSIDDERSLIRTDVLRGGEVVDRAQAAFAEAPAIRAKTRAAVDRLRERLRSDYAGVRARLKLEAQ